MLCSGGKSLFDLRYIQNKNEICLKNIEFLNVKNFGT